MDYLNWLIQKYHRKEELVNYYDFLRQKALESAGLVKPPAVTPNPQNPTQSAVPSIPPAPVPDNVIRVDFKNKKRI